MSGRAGRRGKDDRGIVIQMLDEKMDPQVAKGTCQGCRAHDVPALYLSVATGPVDEICTATNNAKLLFKVAGRRTYSR